MHSAYRLLPNYTYDDYIAWEGKWELIDGIPYAMAPLPTVRHQDISGNIYSIFREALKKAGCGCKAYLPIDYKVSENTVLQPDVLISCADILHKKFISEAPELVVEILSVSTAMKDLNSKFMIYEQQRIGYYLIVDPEKEKIEIHQYRNDKYEMDFSGHAGTFTFNLSPICSISIQLENIWE
jgi:Uma2 family endonuclease